VGIRRQGRELAFKILFQCDQTGDKVNAVVARFQDLGRAQKAAAELAETLAVGAAASLDSIDARIRHCAEHWKLERLLSVDRAILRLAAHELAGCPETPLEVILDEAIELAKRFGGEESPAFVNGVLDRLAAELRPAEKASRDAAKRPPRKSRVGKP
jgi:N utilization substance protein B